jgi:hypothetical protein
VGSIKIFMAKDIAVLEATYPKGVRFYYASGAHSNGYVVEWKTVVWVLLLSLVVRSSNLHCIVV